MGIPTAPGNSDPDITYFHVVTDKRLDGLPAVRALFEGYRGRPVRQLRMADPKVQSSGDTAVLTYTLVRHVGRRPPAGTLPRCTKRKKRLAHHSSHCPRPGRNRRHARRVQPHRRRRPAGAPRPEGADALCLSDVRKSSHIRYDAAGRRAGRRNPPRKPEKLTIARQLARLNVDIIEAGYPASSPEDFEAVRCSRGSSMVARSALVPSRGQRYRGMRQGGWRKPSGRHSHRDRRLGYSHHGKVQGRKIRKNLGEKKVNDRRNGGRGGQTRPGSLWRMWFYAEDAGRGRSAYFSNDRGAIAAGATVNQIPDTTGLCGCRSSTGR